MITTHTPDWWAKPKRTVDKKHWKWAIRKRLLLFEDSICGLFEGFHKEKGERLSFDRGQVMALIDAGGWGSDIGLKILNWAKDQTAGHVRTELRKFLDWGTAKLKKASYPYLPPMPDFAEFRQGKPFANPAKKPVKKNLRSRPKSRPKKHIPKHAR